MQFLKRLMMSINIPLWVLLSSCSTSDRLPSSDLSLATQNARIWSIEEMEQMDYEQLSELDLGDSPLQAVVPLVFSEEGRLLDAKEFNLLVKGKRSYGTTSTFFTDLQTYKDILASSEKLTKANRERLKFYVADYAFQMAYPSQPKQPLSVQNFSDNVYLLDVYALNFETQEAQIEATQRKLRLAERALSAQALVDSNTAVGDITWTNQSSSSGLAWWTGHNGIVTRLNNGLLTGGRRLNCNTRVMEARGAMGKVDGVTSVADEVSENSICVSFRDGPQALLGRPGGMSIAKRLQMRDFARRQNSGGYSIWRNKNDPCVGQSSCTWYCSYLVWKAFINIFNNLELDTQGGYWVTPAEILNTDKLNIYFSQN